MCQKYCFSSFHSKTQGKPRERTKNQKIPKISTKFDFLYYFPLFRGIFGIFGKMKSATNITNIYRKSHNKSCKDIGLFQNLGSILVIFDELNHILVFFAGGKLIFRPVSSFWQILGPIWSVFDNFVANAL